MSRVLVTGAAGSMGIATVSLFRQRGAEVIATDVRPEGLEIVDADMKFVLDVTDGTSVAEVVRQAGRIDHLVNLVGQGFWSPLEIEDPIITRRAFEINALGPIYVMQSVLPQLREHGGGTIVNLSSEAARFIAPMVGLYSAAKAALEAASFAVRLETRHMGIRVAIVRPMPVGTGFSERRYYGTSKDPQYEFLMERVTHDLKQRTSTPMPPIEVANLLWAILEMPDPGFRWFLAHNAEETLKNGPEDTPEEREREAQVAALLA